MYQYEKALFVWGELTNYGITRTTDVTQSVTQHVWFDMVVVPPDIAKATHSSNAICFYFFQYLFNLFRADEEESVRRVLRGLERRHPTSTVISLMSFK